MGGWSIPVTRIKCTPKSINLEQSLWRSVRFSNILKCLIEVIYRKPTADNDCMLEDYPALFVLITFITWFCKISILQKWILLNTRKLRATTLLNLGPSTLLKIWKREARNSVEKHLKALTPRLHIYKWRIPNWQQYKLDSYLNPHESSFIESIRYFLLKIWSFGEKFVTKMISWHLGSIWLDFKVQRTTTDLISTIRNVRKPVSDKLQTTRKTWGNLHLRYLNLKNILKNWYPMVWSYASSAIKVHFKQTSH